MVQYAYSVIQFCPDLARGEAANIGLVLFQVQPGSRLGPAKIKIARNPKRVYRFFSKSIIDQTAYQFACESIRQQIHRVFRSITSIDEFAAFAANQANDIQVTRPILVQAKDPVQLFHRLYSRLVGDDQPKGQQGGIKDILDKRFSRTEFNGKVQKNIHVLLSRMNDELVVPFGYLNGRYNLIQPAKFTKTTGVELRGKAGRYQLEGGLLYQQTDPTLGPLQLVVIADFPSGEDASVSIVKGLLAEANTKMYSKDRIEEFFAEVLNTAKPLPTATDAAPTQTSA